MPTYAYTCRDCGRTTEAVQAFTDASLTVCPHCGGRLRKQYGSVGVTFNGSGFYRTDSRAAAGEKGGRGGEGSKGSGTGGSGDGGAKSDGAAKSDGGSSTPAAKPAGTAASSSAPSSGSGSAA